MKTILHNGRNLNFFILILFFSFFCLLTKSFAQGSTVGLVGHWAMEEDNTVTPLTDSSSSSNDAAVTGSLISQIGKRGYTLVFDGTNDYAVVTDDVSLDMTNAITVAAWVKPSVILTQRIFRKVSGSTGFELFLSSSGGTVDQKVSVRFNDSNAQRRNSTSSYPSDGNTWMHIAATYDGTNIKLYINGTQEGGDLASGNIVANDVGLGIGANHLGNMKFEGAIDDARIYNRALSLSEIQELLTSWAPPSIPIENNGSGYALNFNGTDDYVTVPDATSLDITSAITLEAWIKPSVQATQRIIRKVNTPDNQGYSLFLSNSGKYFSIKFNDDEAKRVNTSELYFDHLNEWIHIAATYDGTTIRTYFNGVPDNTLTTSFTILANAEDLSIGATSAGTDLFTGVMDEVRVWNVARTESQIQDNMSKKLSGSETGLVAYWRFDETTRGLAQDETSNENDGILNKSNNGEHVWSGAAVGDGSASDYTGSGGVFTAALSHSEGDNITATTTSGTITGIQVYRVDDNSLRSGSSVPSGYTVDPLRHWGVKVYGSGTPSYDIVYNYTNHPGIFTETDLRVVKRENISDANWVDVNFTLDEVSNTLTITNQTGTQYALASTSDPLPVELISFTAKVIGNTVKLNWKTETEVNNYGFDIERATDNSDWEAISFIEGNGNSNSLKEYSFIDADVNSSGIYYYRLKQIDNDGTYEYSDVVNVEVGLPNNFYLSQNYPNPFNPTTKIKYGIVQESIVTIKVFDIVGNEVRTLVSEKQAEGSYEIDFNASKLASGIYIYRMQAGNFVQIKKMMILK